MLFFCLFFVVMICSSACSTTNAAIIPQPKHFLRYNAVGPARSLISPLQASTTSVSPLEVTGEAGKKSSLNKPLLSAALSLSYMSIIVSIMSLPIALGALNADKAFFGGIKTTYLSQMLATATLATVLTIISLKPSNILVDIDTLTQTLVHILYTLLHILYLLSVTPTVGDRQP